MKAKGREQAHHTPGHEARRLDQGAVLRWLGVRQRVEPAADALDLAVRDQAAQVLARDPDALDVSRADHTSLTNELDDLLGFGC